MEIVQAVIGVALLAFGRKGLPLFLAALGALAGIAVAHIYFPHASNGLMTTSIIVGAVLGIFAAFFLQKIAVFLAGVLGGGYLGYALAQHMGWIQNGFPWIPVIVCAILGIIFAHFLLKWALIVISSAIGAYLVVGVFELPSAKATPLVIVLAALGIWFQARSGKANKENA
jgi:hypothetical protein